MARMRSGPRAGVWTAEEEKAEAKESLESGSAEVETRGTLVTELRP